MKKKKIFVGIDQGTDSTAIAITDEDYNLLRVRGSDLHSVYLFEAADLKKDSRLHRGSRRRTDRRAYYKLLLEELFAEEINRVDPNFFRRLNDSYLYPEDKHIFQKNALFNEETLDDKTYFKRFPTIYHLRSELIHSDKKMDVRILYLALLNFIDRRGNFLSKGSTEHISSFDEVMRELQEYLLVTFDIHLDEAKFKSVEELLKRQDLRSSEKVKEVNSLKIIMNGTPAQVKAIISGFCGLKASLNNLFDTDSFEKNDGVILSDFSEVQEGKLQDLLGEEYVLIERLNGVYNWMIFSSLMSGKDEAANDIEFRFISDAMVNIYEQHQRELKILKTLVKRNLPEKYAEIFEISKDKLDNYVAFSRKHLVKKQKRKLEYACNHQKFLAYLRKTVFEPCKEQLNEEEQQLFNRLEQGTLLRKQRGAHNATIPYQINLIELKEILKRQANHHPFINDSDGDGNTCVNKIISLFTFKIPYYVGPLNPHSDYAWIERDMNTRITPWNFNTVVDIEKSAENFILRMTNRCTYLIDQNVLPKFSMMYQKYLVLNDLNNIKVNGQSLSVEQKQQVYDELILKKETITLKQLKDFLLSNGIMMKDGIFSGLDTEDKTKRISFKTFHDFKKIGIFNEVMIENVVRDVTLFGAEKEMLKRIIERRYSGELSKQQMDQVLRLSYSGWGRFSEMLLCDLEGIDQETGEINSILGYLWTTQLNLMQILSERFTFRQLIDSHNEKLLEGNTLEDNIARLKLSQPVNKMIRKTFKLLEETLKVAKQKPDVFFVETTREKGESKRTTSRKNAMLDLYKKHRIGKNESLYHELEQISPNKLLAKKYYLYFMQNGRCMYTGDPIDLIKLSDNTLYDIDHIYPKSKIKDDSIHTNLVLVKRDINIHKANHYPIEDGIRKEMRTYWDFLYKCEFISKEKYNRLTRTNPLTEDEVNSFIARQLVETSQGATALAGLLKTAYPEARVVYVKAGHVSEFRKKFGILKTRELNNHHHAKDAYLNIVVGNVYDKLFTPQNRLRSINELLNGKISLNRLFESNIEGAWSVENEQSITTVKKVLKKNTIRVVREVIEKKGGLFNQQIVGKRDDNKDSGILRIATKKNPKLQDFSKYGYYDNVSVAYFALVRRMKGKNEVLTLVPVYMLAKDDAKSDFVRYCKEYLKMDILNVIVEKIGINSVFEVDGKELYIKGKTNDSILMDPKFELIVTDKQEYTIYHCIHYLEKAKNYLKESKNSVSSDYHNPFYTSKNGKQDAILTHDKLIELYDVLTSKLFISPFVIQFDGGQSSFTKIKDEAVLDRFKNLGLYEKSNVINELLKMLKSDSQVADLTSLGLKKLIRVQLIRDFISYEKYKSICINSYSPSGFFKKVIRIK